jgi:hypothetical protein
LKIILNYFNNGFDKLKNRQSIFISQNKKYWQVWIGVLKGFGLGSGPKE